jgi:hypothetical protein
MKHRPPSRASGRAALALLGPTPECLPLLPPPPERAQHSRVSRSAETMVDADGGIGQPWIAEGTLLRLLRRGEIDAEQWHAGTRFAEAFDAAGLHPLRAAQLVRRIAGGDLPNGAEHARRIVEGALDALGGIHTPLGSVSWFVLGLDLSLDEWRRREGWAGRALRHETATLALVGALGVLASHFRTPG